MRRNLLFFLAYFAAIASDWVMLSTYKSPSDQGLASYYLYLVLAAGVALSFFMKPTKRVLVALLPAIAFESVARFYYINGAQAVEAAVAYAAFFCFVYSLPVLFYLALQAVSEKVHNKSFNRTPKG